MELIKRAKWAYIIVSACLIALGILLILFPEISAITLCYIIGAIMVIFGIIKLVGYFSNDIFRLAFQFDLALGVFSLVAGVLFIFHPLNIVSIMPVIIGVFVVIDGAFKLQTTVDSKRFGMKQWWLILLLAVITLICGLFLIIDPFGGAQALMVLLGITLLADGIQNLCTVIYTVKEARASTNDGNVRIIEIEEKR